MSTSVLGVDLIPSSIVSSAGTKTIGRSDDGGTKHAAPEDQYQDRRDGDHRNGVQRSDRWHEHRFQDS